MLARLVLILTGLVVGLLATEFLVRTFYPQVTYSGGVAYLDPQRLDLAANFQGQFSHPDYRYSVHTSGLRTRITSGNSDNPQALRILVLGDSFAFGMGVNDQQTFSSVLATHLNQAGIATKVINAAVPAYSLTEEWCKYRQLNKIFQPQIVIVASCFNDFAANLESCERVNGSLVDRPQTSILDPKLTLWQQSYPEIRDLLLSHSHLSILLATRFNQLLIRLGLRDAFRAVTAAYSPTYYQQNDKRITHVTTVLRNLYQLIEQDQAQAIFLYIPGLLEIDKKLLAAAQEYNQSLDPQLAAHHVLSSARNAGFKNVIDLRAEQPVNTQWQQAYFPIDMHLNQFGHQMVAEILANRITEMQRN